MHHSIFFFVNYYNGKCTVQNVGINKFGNLGKTSATVLVLDAGGGYYCAKRRVGWKSTTVAEGYIENSINVSN
ncbi:hypothetical protein NQ318_020996 [Aromia moschata]|uniref:Uncharacterized protein n=1 Tax=Aromia moschata TaxID=1265417 RepID=A0AAV8YP76_9CUCU|nr:hypothetical protein NQ318_020996 [Aromia moschata]